jgi:hypothetical protein
MVESGPLFSLRKQQTGPTEQLFARFDCACVARIGP